MISREKGGGNPSADSPRPYLLGIINEDFQLVLRADRESLTERDIFKDRVAGRKPQSGRLFRRQTFARLGNKRNGHSPLARRGHLGSGNTNLNVVRGCEQNEF